MAQQQLTDTSVTSYLSSLTGGRMMVLLSQQQIVLTIGAFMVKRRNAFQSFVQRRNITCVAAIGVGSRWFCRSHKTAVCYNFTVGSDPIGTGLDVIHLTDGNLVEVYHVTTDMWQQVLLAENIPATGHPMFQRNRLDSQRTVVVDDLLLTGIDSMEINLIVEVVAEHAHLLLQHILQFPWGIYRQSCRAPQESESAEHPYQSETMVAMQVCDKHGADFGETDVRTSQLHLCSFGTIHQKQFTPHLYHLCRSIVARCG